MLTKKTIGFLGAGNMGEAIIKGLISSGAASAGQLIASDSNKSRLLHIAETYEVKVFNKNYEVVKTAEIIVLAVKPSDLAAVCEEIALELDPDKLLVSIVAGKTIETIQHALRRFGLGQPVPMVRAMPNMPATIGLGATAIFAGSGVKGPAKKLARKLFESVGRVVEVREERLLDAVTGLSGSGPAYVYLIMDALIEAGVKAGLNRKEAKELVVQTTLGAATLAQQTDKDLAHLIKTVSSPGGTTIEGLKKLEGGDIRALMAATVEAATERATELAQTP